MKRRPLGRTSGRVPIDQLTGKEALMGMFTVLTGVVDFFEGLERGDEPLVAAKKAVRKTKRRRAALALAEQEVLSDEAVDASVTSHPPHSPKKTKRP